MKYEWNTGMEVLFDDGKKRSIFEISRITETGRVVAHSCINPKDVVICSPDGVGYTRKGKITPLTKDLAEQLHKERVVGTVLQRIHKIDDLTYDQAIKIQNILGA